MDITTSSNEQSLSSKKDWIQPLVFEIDEEVINGGPVIGPSETLSHHS